MAELHLDVHGLHEREADGTPRRRQRAQGRNAPAVLQHDRVVEVAGRGLDQGDSHQMRVVGVGDLGRLGRLAGHQGGPQRCSFGELDHQELLGGVVQPVDLLAAICAGRIEHQVGFGQPDPCPGRLVRPSLFGLEYQSRPLEAGDGQVGLGDAAEDFSKLFPAALPAAERLQTGKPVPVDDHLVAARTLQGNGLAERTTRADDRDGGGLGLVGEHTVVLHQHAELAHHVVLQLEPHANGRPLGLVDRLDRLLPQHGHVDAALAHPMGEEELDPADTGLLDGEIQQERLLDRPIRNADVGDRLAIDDRPAKRKPQRTPVIGATVVDRQPARLAVLRVEPAVEVT